MHHSACITLRDPDCLGYVYGIHASQSLSANVNRCQASPWVDPIATGTCLVPEFRGPTILYVDNSGAVELSKDLKSCQRSRHIERRYLKVRELVAKGEIEVRYCPTKENVADALTKLC